MEKLLLKMLKIGNIMENEITKINLEIFVIKQLLNGVNFVVGFILWKIFAILHNLEVQCVHKILIFI